MAAVELEVCIRFWKGELQHSVWMMDVTTQVFIESTIKHLEELKEIKDKEKL